jgi:branched-chain amino acid transport system permease protein
MTRSSRLALACAGALVLLPLAVRDSFFLNAFILASLFGAMAQAWNLIGGYAGQISFGHAVFFGLGAYAAAVPLGRYGVAPWLDLAGGAALSAVVSLAIGLPTFRLRRHFFALGTLALGEITRILFLNWPYVGAAVGLYLPLQYRNRLGYLMWDDKLPYAYTALALLGLATAVVAAFDRHRAGIYLRAIDQDEDAAEMLGIPTRRYKLYAMALSAALTSACGTAYALYVLYIDPYNVMAGRVSLLAVVIALIGGRATVAGPVIGAAFIVFLGEYTRSSLGTLGTGADFILFGLLIMVISIREPGGLASLVRRHLGERAPADDAAGAGPAPAPGRAAGGGPPVPAPAPGGRSRDPVLRISGLHKRFGGVHAVRGVTLDVRRGEICGLIGPNGAGKTTLFDCVTGGVRVDQGSVRLDGRELRGLKPHRIAWAGISRTFQAMRIFPGLSVWENILCGWDHRAEPLWDATVRANGADVLARGRALLEAVNLWELRARPAGALSYGQQKLLSIAMAVMRRPAVVLLDEPAAGVNPRLVDEIAARIRELNAQGMTFLVIEHNMDMIMRLAHRIVFMAGGEVVAIGAPEEIQRNETVRDLYYGR